MTVAAASRKQAFNGSGSTGPFTFNFRILEESGVLVTKVVDGVSTVLTSPADYSVSLTDLGLSGGSLSLSEALAIGEQLFIEGSTPITQETSYANQGRFFPNVHEKSYDKLTLIAQEQSQLVDRSIKIPLTEDPDDYTMTLPEEADRADKALIFDADGNVTVSDDDYNDQLANVTAQAALATAAAAAAAISEDNAADSAALAATGLRKTTSTTSLTINTSQKTLTLAAEREYGTGDFVKITDQANNANYMWGVIDSYSHPTLIMTPTTTGGSGTISAWYVAVSGERGATGATGAQGPAGSGSGDMIAPGTITAGNLYMAGVSPTAAADSAIAATSVAIGAASATAAGNIMVSADTGGKNLADSTLTIAQLIAQAVYSAESF